MEYRAFRAETVSDDGTHLSGVLAPFNSETVIGRLDRGGWREEIAPGAFRKAIQESDTVLLCDHDMSRPLARVSAKTLRLEETDTALRFDADIVDTTYARDLLANIRAGNKGGMSIGFDPVKDDWFDDDGNPSNRHVGTRRVLREVKLPEGSVVTNPAYKDTSVMARDELLAERETRAEERAGNKPYGDVKYADPKNGKYPIDTEEHIRAAWSYINMPKNAAKYPLNGVTLSEVKARIRTAMKGLGAKVDDDDRAEDVPQADHYEDDFYETEEPRSEPRDDPDGKEYAAMRRAVEQLDGEKPDVAGAIKTLRAALPSRSQEPDTSTPEDENDDALTTAFAQAMGSRQIGFG